MGAFFRRLVPALLTLPFLVPAGAAAAEPGAPEVRRITGGERGYPQGSFVRAPTTIDLAAAGYVEEEFTLSGTATAYTGDGSLGTDGRWRVRPVATAPYTTRLLVFRPADPRRFNGTAVLEWANVSGMHDAFPDWGTMHRQLLRGGYAFVGVAAQEAGVTDGRRGLKAWDPVRYAALDHPGDNFSYDIYRQAGIAVRDALGDLRPRTVIADGDSQSAQRLLTYVNAFGPHADVFDAFLLHGRNAVPGPLLTPPLGLSIPAPGAFVRPDLDVPVLQVQSETDVTEIGVSELRQPDAARLRTWEVAGTGHGDEITETTLAPTEFRDFDFLPKVTAEQACLAPVNDGPMQYVLGAGLDALAAWARGGPAPARADRLELRRNLVGQQVPQRDSAGIIRGGVRTPDVDAPLFAHRGDGNVGWQVERLLWCPFYGSSNPLDAATVARLHPTHEAYVADVRRSADAARGNGFLAPADATALIAAAEASGVGRQRNSALYPFSAGCPPRCA